MKCVVIFFLVTQRIKRPCRKKHYNQKYNKISRQWSADVLGVIKSSRSIWRMKIANETKTLSTICCRFSAPLFLQSSVTRGLAVSRFAQNAELNDRQSTPKYHHSHQNNYNNKESKLYYKALERPDRQTNESYACCRPGLPACQWKQSPIRRGEMEPRNRFLAVLQTERNEYSAQR